MSDMMQAIINSKKIKYVILNNLIKDLPQDTEEINLFISIESIIKSFYATKVNEIFNSLDQEDKYLLSSELINVAAHYRHYFWSRFNMPSNFYFYYSDEKAFHNTVLDNDYRNTYYTKRFDSKSEYYNLNKIIDENLNLSNILSEYLPNIYFINTRTLEPSILPYHIISKLGSIQGVTNVILTNNTLDYQLVSLPNTFIIEMKMDKSFVISKDNLYQILLKKSKIKNDTPLSHVFYPSILSISGYKSYNIEGIKGMGMIKTISKLEKAIASGIIGNDIVSSDITLISGKLFENKDTINKNYKVLSYSYQNKNISPKEIFNIKQQITNKSDNMSLMEINRLYYERYPLMLIELMEGE